MLADRKLQTGISSSALCRCRSCGQLRHTPSQPRQQLRDEGAHIGQLELLCLHLYALCAIRSGNVVYAGPHSSWDLALASLLPRVTFYLFDPRTKVKSKGNIVVSKTDFSIKRLKQLKLSSLELFISHAWFLPAAYCEKANITWCNKVKRKAAICKVRNDSSCCAQVNFSYSGTRDSYYAARKRPPCVGKTFGRFEHIYSCVTTRQQALSYNTKLTSSGHVANPGHKSPGQANQG